MLRPDLALRVGRCSRRVSRRRPAILLLPCGSCREGVGPAAPALVRRRWLLPLLVLAVVMRVRLRLLLLLLLGRAVAAAGCRACVHGVLALQLLYLLLRVVHLGGQDRRPCRIAFMNITRRADACTGKGGS